MDETDTASLDTEFNRYLQILRPYLVHLMHQNVIEICNAWIQRLSNCKNSEKNLRNRYIFALCFQVARGFLDGPFTEHPPKEDLPPLADEFNGNESSTEEECVVIDPDEPVTTVLYANIQSLASETEYRSQENDGDGIKEESRLNNNDSKHNNYDTNDAADNFSKNNAKSFPKIYTQSNMENYRHDFTQSYAQNYTPNTAMQEQTIFCYTCPETIKSYGYYENTGEHDNYRAVGLIKKLRDIKTQNRLLTKELIAMKEETKTRTEEITDEHTTKISNSSFYIHANESSSTLKSLKCKLQEVQESRNRIIETIGALQDKLDNFADMKKHEIEEIEAKHKLEVIKLKTSTREEVKKMYDKKMEELKKSYEDTFKEVQTKSVTEEEDIITSKEAVIAEKSKIIIAKDIEIARLKSQIEDQKNSFHGVLSKFLETPSENSSNDHDSIRIRAQQLEKRLKKLEKSKNKCAIAYEARVAALQREKHLGQCTLQLQLAKQRAQVVHEVTDENQTELTAALARLETKYKEIVANVQATAIQRRMQDQIALESILQAACGMQSDTLCSNGRLSRKTMPNQNQSCDREISNLLRWNKVDNKSFGEDSVTAGYCLNGEGMGELFDGVHIPQRDNGAASP